MKVWYARNNSGLWRKKHDVLPEKNCIIYPGISQQNWITKRAFFPCSNNLFCLAYTYSHYKRRKLNVGEVNLQLSLR